MPINSLLYPSNVFVPTAYNVANSCRFNSGSSDRLYKSQSTGNQKTYTFSFWIKRSILSAQENIIGARYGGQGRYAFLRWNGDDPDKDKLEFHSGIYSTSSTSTSMSFKTNRLFRDVSAWYHIVLAVDTTQGTESNRVKIYVNGVQETSFTTATYPSVNQNHFFNISTTTLEIGAQNSDSYLNAYMAEFCLIDGQQLTPTSFGGFDEDSGIWKPIDVSGLTFGTNGFYLDFKDSANLGNDANGGTDLTEANLTAVDQSTDTCTNNALVLNPLSANASYVFSEGNLAVAINGVNLEKKIIPSTFGSSSGKWYWEVKNTSSSNQNYIHAGFVDADVIGQFITGSQSNAPYSANNGYGNFIQGQGTPGDGISVYKAGSSNYNTSTTWLADQIGMFALDLDNRKAWFGVNGTWINDASGNTGNPATGANPTWGSNDLISTDKVWIPASTGYYSGPSCSYNFGSPPYAISSGNTDGNSYGNFEYAVPSGFYTWNTKNLAEFG